MKHQNVIASVFLSLLAIACKTPAHDSTVKDTGISQAGFDRNGDSQSCVPLASSKPCLLDSADEHNATALFAQSCTDGGFLVIRCTPPATDKCGLTLCSGNAKKIPSQVGYDIHGNQQTCVPYSGKPLLCSPVPEQYLKDLAAFKEACTAGGFQVIGCVDAPDGRCGGVACTSLVKKP